MASKQRGRFRNGPQPSSSTPERLKPSAILANSRSYSDGSLFPRYYKHAKLSPFVGEPVPGTGTSVWWIHLLPGGRLQYGIPEISRKSADGRYYENTEDNPDVLVRRSPDAIEEGRDEQLERAVEHLLGQFGGPAMKK